jgi:hypothetical protein
MFNTAECIAFDGKVEAAVLAAALAKAVGECEALKGHFEDDKEAVCFVPPSCPWPMQRSPSSAMTRRWPAPGPGPICAARSS